MFTGPKIVTEGLVFGFDTGYPFVSASKDSYRFNLGEPTTNKLNNNILGTGNGASLGSDDFGTYIQLADQTTSYSRFQIPNITVVSNEVYTWSFELYSTETITQSGNKYYFDTNEYSNQFSTSNDLSRVGFTQIRPSELTAGEWTKFSLTVTMKPNLTGAYSYDFFNMLYPHFQNKKIYYRNMQFETKPHNTAYAGQNGTRSVSGSLIDLTRTTDIDLSNVSFDSNAQMTFDGTDDYILYSSTQDVGTVFTVNFWIKPNGKARQSIVANGYPYQTNKGFFIACPGNTTNSDSFFLSLGADDNYVIAANGSLTQGVWQMVTCRVNGPDNLMKLYVNGIETNYSHQDNGNTTLQYDTGDFLTGRRTLASSDFLESPVSLIQIYNRALTEEEVKQNYKGYKGRFNI